jgi:hypothetical protein
MEVRLSALCAVIIKILGIHCCHSILDPRPIRRLGEIKVIGKIEGLHGKSNPRPPDLKNSASKLPLQSLYQLVTIRFPRSPRPVTGNTNIQVLITRDAKVI